MTNSNLGLNHMLTSVCITKKGWRALTADLNISRNADSLTPHSLSFKGISVEDVVTGSDRIALLVKGSKRNILTFKQEIEKWEGTAH